MRVNREQRGWKSLRYAVALATVALALSIPAVAGAVEPPLLRNFCPGHPPTTGHAGGECEIPRGIAVDESIGETLGNTYISNQANRRIEKFTAWGEFTLAWGWDVVASGPGNKGGGFEVCVRVNGDVCQKGLTGSGAGEFGEFGPQGVAVDSIGDIYVADWSNRRVQKFSPEGEFLLTFGGEVNKTKVDGGKPEAERNVCPIVSGDECKAGVQGTGKGQFGGWELGSYISIDRKGTETAADDIVYVGDVGRVQEFDTAGHYLKDLPDPDEVLKTGGTVNSLAVDQGSGSIYLGFLGAFASKNDLQKVDATGKTQCTVKTRNPTGIAVGPEGGLYVVEGLQVGGVPREIARFNSSCGGRELIFGPEFESTAPENEFSANPTGIAASGACREVGESGIDLVISNPDQTDSFVKLFGPPPNANLCPPPAKPPLIAEQFTSSVGSVGASVRARINPRFWPDTSYFVQYGTAACLEGPEEWNESCVKEQPAAPGIELEDAAVNALLDTKSVFLGATEPLQPDTDYRYRFVAESGFELLTPNGPVFGKGGGEETAPEVFDPEGQSGAFRTLPLPGTGKADCPNQVFRSGPSAPLPDCRAFEMVSPLDKNNGDVASPRVEVIEQTTPNGEAITFAGNTFGEPESAPSTSQYLAERTPAGWSTHSINAPRNSIRLTDTESLRGRYKAFGENLCSGWLVQDTEMPLVGGEVPQGVPGLYRRGGLREGCEEPDGYELLSTVFPPGFDPSVEKGKSRYYAEIQGFSADEETSAYRANGALADDACRATVEVEGKVLGEEGSGIFQVYLSHKGTPGVPPVLISLLPSGQAACTHSSVGTMHSLSGAASPREDSTHNAVSQDGTRIYWTLTQERLPPTKGASPGRLFLRLNPLEESNSLPLGGANGKGNLIGPATGTGGSTTNIGKQIKEVVPTSGQFTVGQVVIDSAEKLQPETKITAIAEEEPTPEEKEEGKTKSGRLILSIDKGATGKTTQNQITGLASEVVTNLTTEEGGAFQAGQRIAGPGIVPGTTILSCAPACGGSATSLTLSAKVTETRKDSPLEASSSCTDLAKACTLPVSEEGERLSGTNSASRYLDAASDGSVAFFETGGDLYEYDLAKALANETPTALIAHEANGILGASEDGSHLYLVSEEDLDEGASAGEPNLYLYEREGGAFAFVATLGDSHDVTAGDTSESPSSVGRYPSKHLSRVTPDGLHAAFTSADPTLAEQVAGLDNTDADNGRPDREIYLYDATANGGAGSLICASCNPSGARPAGRLVEKIQDDPSTWISAAARLPGWTTAMHPGKLLSDEGGRLFFESFEALVPRDTNGRGDVYEWQLAKDKDECRKDIGGELFVAKSSGCLALISSGQGGADAEVIDASADGHDVFFVTDARLVGQDTDQFRDVYDARVGGGFPPPVPPKPPCEGDACQNPPAPPAAMTPASEAPSNGSGNLPTQGAKRHCAKGKRRVVRKGKARCVPKPRKHRRHRRAGK